MAQRTGLNPCEFVTIKVDIMSFVMPNNRTTVPVIKLIPILQSSKNGESVFFFFFFFFLGLDWFSFMWSLYSQSLPRRKHTFCRNSHTFPTAASHYPDAWFVVQK